MTRGPLSFKQRDLERAIRAAKAAGLTVSRIDFVNGKPSLVIGSEVDNAKGVGVESWDRAIAELESRR